MLLATFVVGLLAGAPAAPVRDALPVAGIERQGVDRKQGGGKGEQPRGASRPPEPRRADPPPERRAEPPKPPPRSTGEPELRRRKP